MSILVERGLRTLHREARDTRPRLGDFSASPRLIYISALAIIVGIVGAFLALILLYLIHFFTSLFFFQRISFQDVSPSRNHLGLAVLFVPVIGGIIVGLMARYGSEKIRGHGIPEAIEAILINGSKVEPRLAILKPVSSAITIGSGGPFGAEGPIIMTGGAFGSLIAQLLRLSSSERKTLLVAGAAAGMAAVFGAPLAAIALAVEVLLFEWRPRSLIPVAISSAIAGALRYYLLGAPPIFPTPTHTFHPTLVVLVDCFMTGLVAGLLSLILTWMVYTVEDIFRKLPVHWMWWPAIGGIFVGIGGLIYPRALGVGYDVIADMLRGQNTWQLILGILLVKSAIWAIALGSGTSGGVLAPILMIGGSIGIIESHIFPSMGEGFWPILSMAAVLGGAMRAPLTAIIFALELTHDIHSVIPLILVVIVSYGFTVLTMRRSILTEKLDRRGYHLTYEYSPDPLELHFASEAMDTNAKLIPKDMTVGEFVDRLGKDIPLHQRLYPIVGDNNILLGIVTQSLIKGVPPSTKIIHVAEKHPIVAYPYETMRSIAYRMAEHGITRMPVVEPDSERVLGIITLGSLLQARKRRLLEERVRERVIKIKWNREPIRVRTN